jgi:multidrug efflux pump
VEFELSVDLETAANDVRDKVSQAQRYLPRDATLPPYQKPTPMQNPILMIAVKSPKRSLLDFRKLQNLHSKNSCRPFQE